MSNIARSSLVVTVFVCVGMILDFFSNVVIAANFGAGKDMDVFLVATTLPLFITGIFSGLLNFTFIPIFAEYRAKNSEEIWKVVSSIINLSIVISTIICVIGIASSSQIIKAISPGFSEQKIIQASELLQLLFPIIIFTTVNDLMASVYYSNQQFVVPSLNKIVSPLLTISSVLLFHSYLNTKSIVLAMMTATFVQTVLLAIGFMRRHDFSYMIVFNYKHPGVLKILKLMTPLLLGMLVYRAVPVFDRYFLSMMPEGSISRIGYARKLLNVIPPTISSGIAISIFPIMSKYAAENNLVALKEVVLKGVKMLFFLSMPFVVLLSIYGRNCVQLVFERGVFSAADTSIVYHVFVIYLLSLPASVVGSIVSQCFYVMQLNRIISIIGVMMSLFYVAICLLLISKFNYMAIPIAYVVYCNCALIATAFVISRKFERGTSVVLIPFILKILLVLTLVCLILYPIGKLGMNNVLFLNGLCVSGFLMYFLIAKAVFNLGEANLVWQTIATRFNRERK